MALSSGFFTSQACLSFKVDRTRLPCNNITCQRFDPALKSKNIEIFGQQLGKEVSTRIGWSFRQNLGRNIPSRKSSAVYASWLPCSQIASGAFTLGTAAVLPFYTLMVVAPQAEFTKKIVASSLPYMFLGALYGYLLYLSWTPDTIATMFASKYWLPELSGMAKMFSNEMTMASAWIHLLTVDLFAARQVYSDGVQNNIGTRHSVSLCLLFCPIGILAHVITKALTRGRKEKSMEVAVEEAISSDFIK